MATAPPISQRIRLDGSEEIQQNLVKLGELGERAFEQMRRAAANLNFQGVSRDMKAVGDAAAQVASGAGRLSEEIGKLSGSSRDAGSALTSFGSATAQAASTADRAAASISSVVKTFALLGAGLVAVGASIIASAKSAATAASEIGKAADTLGQDDIASYQKLNFVLRQLGLTSGEADAAIKKMGEEADDAAVKLSKTALELQSLFQKRGTSFAPTAQGFNLMRRELAGLAQQAAQGTIPFVTLRDMLAKFQDETDPNKLKAFQNELAKLVDASKGAPNAMRGVVSVMRDTQREATGIVTPLQEVRSALAAMQKDTNPANLVRFAAALTGIEDEAKRTKFAVDAMGEFAGRRLVSELKSSDSAISQLIARYGQLRIGVSDADREISDKFNASLTEMAVVSRQSRTELGLLFAPALTPLITNFNTLMRANSGTLLNFGATIRDTVIPVLEDLLKMFQGVGDAEIKTEWLVTLREGFKSAGKVIREILTPAFNAAERAMSFLIATVNEFFGSKFTLADAGILGAVTLLIGGFNALAVAVLAVFTSATPSIADFKEKLKGIGIDIDAIKKTFKGFAQSVSADLKAMFVGNNDAVKNKWLLDLKEILTGLPGIIVGVVGALTLLGRAIKFIGADKAILVFLAQITGILPIFATLLIGAAAVSTILVNGLKVLGLALAGIVGLIGWPATLVAGLAVLLFNMERAKVVFDAVAAALNSLFGTKLDGLDLQIGAILGIVAALALVVTRAAAARTALLSLSVIPIVAAFLGVHQVVKDLAGSGGPLDALDNKIENLGRDLVAGRVSLQEYEQQVAKLRNSSAAAATKDTATSVADEWKKITDTLKGVSTQSNQTVQTVKSGWAQVSPGVWQKMSEESGKAVDQINSKWQQLAPGVFQRLGTDVKRATDEIKGGVAAAGDGVEKLGSQLEGAAATALSGIERINQAFDALAPGGQDTDFSDSARSAKTLSDNLGAAKSNSGELTAGMNRFDAAIDNVNRRWREIRESTSTVVVEGGKIVQGATQYAPAVESARKAWAQVLESTRTIEVADGKIVSGAGEYSTKIDGAGKKWQQILESIRTINVESQNIKIPDSKPEDDGEDEDNEAVSGRRRESLTELLTLQTQLDQQTDQLTASYTSLADAFGPIQTTAQTVMEAVSASITSAFASVEASIQSLMAQLDAAIAKVRDLTTAAATAGGGNGDDLGGFARGGYVRGPGTSTSDSILARLSRGEFVQREKAVRYYGTDFMAALNALRIPKDMFRGFNAGGLVDGLNQSLSALMIPRFNAGGLAVPVASAGRNLHPVTINMANGGSVGGLFAPTNVVRQLTREAIAEQSGSTGRKPSWVR